MLKKASVKVIKSSLAAKEPSDFYIGSPPVEQHEGLTLFKQFKAKQPSNSNSPIPPLSVRDRTFTHYSLHTTEHSNSKEFLFDEQYNTQSLQPPSRNHSYESLQGEKSIFQTPGHSPRSSCDDLQSLGKSYEFRSSPIAIPISNKNRFGNA